MTHHPIKILEDGTRVYSNYTRRKPIPLSERKYAIRKPDDPLAVRWYGDWLLPLPLIDDDLRILPETVPDTDAYDHMTRIKVCTCDVCKRESAQKWRDRWCADNPDHPRTLKERKLKRRARKRARQMRKLASSSISS